MRNFSIWFFSSFILGLFPMICNSICQYLFGNIGYYSVLKTSDSMYFLIMIGTTAMIDIITKNRGHFKIFPIIALVSFIFQLLCASMLIGFNSYAMMATPIDYDNFIIKLLKLSIFFLIVFTITTTSFQLILYTKFYNSEHDILKSP